MARQKSITPATVFSATVRAALEHVADPQWLGEHSPLATPYFLGRQSPDGSYPTEARDRGLVLQNAIREAVRVPVFLAGGLHAENVRQAIETVRPFGVDLCSGVRTDGSLDEARLEQFMRAVTETG